jgi:hypothetical protein
MRAEGKHVHVCPECGQPVTRVHRHFADRWAALFLRVHRYRCTSPACGWEGIVSRPPQPVAPFRSVTWAARFTWMSIGALCTVAIIGSFELYRRFDAPAAKSPPFAADVIALPQVEQGESFDGTVLPDGDPRVADNQSDLVLRRGCAWGVPGRSPYQGTITQALAGARLPDEIVHKVAAMVERGVVSDRVEIRRDSIRTVSGKRRFDPTIVAMGFGRTLCFGTRVNFQPGHVEQADLYDAVDAAGTRFAVMVPYVCGNVSVLAERAERPDEGGNGRSVPEPGTLAILVAGLAAIAFVRALRSGRNRSVGRRFTITLPMLLCAAGALVTPAPVHGGTFVLCTPVLALGATRRAHAEPAPADKPVAKATTGSAVRSFDVAALREAAGRGDAQAQFDLAAALDCGRNVRRDRTAALQWLRRAAAQGHVGAQSALGWKYMTGNGVRRDDAEAFAWLRQAAERGNTSAQNNLGILYAQGRGVVANATEAERWFRLAAAKGAVDAQRNLDRLRGGHGSDAATGIEPVPPRI